MLSFEIYKISRSAAPSFVLPARGVTFLLIASLVLNLYLAEEHRQATKSFAESERRQSTRNEAEERLGVKANLPFVYYAFQENVERVVASVDQSGASDLPRSLLIQPGKYRFEGSAYRLQNEGLYRFGSPGHENQQRIVFSGNLDALLSGIAWIFSHGSSDEGKSFADLSTKALTSKIFVTCGGICDWTQMLLQSVGIKSRVVASLTLDSWNHYDDGHTLIEVYRDSYKKWVVYDLDNNAYFVRDNIPLSFIEFSDHVAAGDYDIKRLASDSRFDVSNFTDSEKQYDYAFLMEGILANEKSLRSWYKRVVRVPMIEDKGNYIFFDDVNRSRIETYSPRFKYMDKEQFMAQF
jgi:hypothetical protein